jgi:hypothetical protein
MVPALVRIIKLKSINNAQNYLSAMDTCANVYTRTNYRDLKFTVYCENG